MPLTKEQLLIPRYKCIALWMFEPKSSLGAIYEQPNVHRGGQWTAMWNWWDEMANHPHLFQPLPWWSDRNPEDMPQYYKHTGNHGIFKTNFRPQGGTVMLQFSSTETIPTSLEYTLPATEEEYTAYINQKQQ